MQAKKWLLLIFGLVIAEVGHTQGPPLPLGHLAYQLLDRMDILSGRDPGFHPSMKFYERGDITRFALGIDSAGVLRTRRDRFDLDYIFLDNNEWLLPPNFPTTVGGPRNYVYPDTQLTRIEISRQHPAYRTSRRPWFNTFYRTPANLFEVNSKYFYLRVNPMLNVKAYAGNENAENLFTNQRGLRLRGGVDDRVYFFLDIVESQAQFPRYVRNFIDTFQALPGNGLYKRFESSLFNSDNAYDFLNSQGMIGFHFTPHIGLQFGYGRNFIGNGYRSMLWSDFSNNRLYLKLNWKVWKFQYQNLFTELAATSANEAPGNQIVGKKYAALHHLSFNITPDLNVGLFEAVIFRRNNQFEFQYLVPVILYRTIEQGLGSPDNVLLGFDAHWNFLRRFQVYGQLIFDEFVFNELFVDPQGWWGNKFGIQIGGKYINAFGIEHLDLQAEHNLARPYTYTHFDSTANYAHYNMALAHPLGANFRESIFIGRYRPVPRLFLEARLILAEQGQDPPGQNFGSNILLSYDTREQNYGNEIGQGINTTTSLLGIDISYMLAHNVFVDLHYFRRNESSEALIGDVRTQYIGGGIRINMRPLRMDF